MTYNLQNSHFLPYDKTIGYYHKDFFMEIKEEILEILDECIENLQTVKEKIRKEIYYDELY